MRRLCPKAHPVTVHIHTDTLTRLDLSASQDVHNLLRRQHANRNDSLRRPDRRQLSSGGRGSGPQ